MIIAEAGAEDLAEILALEGAFAQGERWSESSWEAELLGEGRTVLVARDDTTLLGVVALVSTGDVTDLYRIIVSPAARRRGIADNLLREGFARVDTRVLLEVRDDNFPAIALYNKHGFTTISTRPDYYALGVDALIMERPAPERPAGRNDHV